MHARTHNSSGGGRFNVSPFIQVSQELPVELLGDSVVTPFVPSFGADVTPFVPSFGPDVTPVVPAFGTESLPPTRYHRNERLENLRATNVILFFKMFPLIYSA